MGKQVKITINDKVYPVKFGYGAVRYLGIYLREDTYDGTLAKVGTLFGSLAAQEKEGANISFEVLDTLGYLVLSGIDYAHQEEDHGVHFEEIVDMAMQDASIFMQVVEAFVAAMPKQIETGNPKAPKKGAVKNVP